MKKFLVSLGVVCASSSAFADVFSCKLSVNKEGSTEKDTVAIGSEDKVMTAEGATFKVTGVVNPNNVVEGYAFEITKGKIKALIPMKDAESTALTLMIDGKWYAGTCDKN